MATAEELLALNTVAGDAEEEILVVNPNTRVIAIPANITCLGVESDDDVNRLRFTMPRYYGEFDLSEFAIRVNFENERREGDLYDVVDKTVTEDGESLTFSWLVDRTAFTRAGDVTFSLCLKLYGNGEVIKEWNTTTATLPVLKGLETESAITEANTSVLDQIYMRLYAVEAISGVGVNGYYTVVKMEENDSGVLFSIINQDGTIEAIVKHGYTPVKGVDYWTTSEQAEIKNYAAEYAKSYAQSWAPFTTKVTLTVAGWSSNTQTVNANGVKADSIVLVSPASSSYAAYNTAQICCTAQGDDTLTFSCNTPPTAAITVDVVVFYNSDKFPLTYPYSNTTKTTNGITFTDNGDGSITANGTATSTAYFFMRSAEDKLGLGAGRYKISGCPAGGSANTYSIRILPDNDSSISDTGSGNIFTLTTSDSCRIYIQITSGATVSDLTFSPFLEKLSVGTFTVIDDGEGNITIV